MHEDILGHKTQTVNSCSSVFRRACTHKHMLTLKHQLSHQVSSFVPSHSGRRSVRCASPDRRSLDSLLQIPRGKPGLSPGTSQSSVRAMDQLERKDSPCPLPRQAGLGRPLICTPERLYDRSASTRCPSMISKQDSVNAIVQQAQSDGLSMSSSLFAISPMQDYTHFTPGVTEVDFDQIISPTHSHLSMSNWSLLDGSTWNSPVRGAIGGKESKTSITPSEISGSSQFTFTGQDKPASSALLRDKKSPLLVPVSMKVVAGVLQLPPQLRASVAGRRKVYSMSDVPSNLSPMPMRPGLSKSYRLSVSTPSLVRADCF